MNLKSIIKNLFIQKPKPKTQPFLEKEIKCRTIYPDKQLNFNEWSQNIHLLNEKYKSKHLNSYI